jgi:hypothetical protein
MFECIFLIIVDMPFAARLMRPVLAFPKISCSISFSISSVRILRAFHHFFTGKRVPFEGKRKCGRHMAPPSVFTSTRSPSFLKTNNSTFPPLAGRSSVARAI